MKGYSQDLRIYYKQSLDSLLKELSDSVEVNTHHFEQTFKSGIRHFGFVGKSNRPHLLKCLWSLESDGLIENIKLGGNVYKWKITQAGVKSLDNK